MDTEGKFTVDASGEGIVCMSFELVPLRNGLKFDLKRFSGDGGRSDFFSFFRPITVPKRFSPPNPVGRRGDSCTGGEEADPDRIRRAPPDVSVPILALSSEDPARCGTAKALFDAARLFGRDDMVGALSDLLATNDEISSAVFTFSIALRQLSAETRFRST